MGVLFDLWEARDTYFSDQSFWRTVLLNMQNDTTNTASECIDTWDDFMTLTSSIESQWATDASYLAGLVEKGQADGTNVGFLIAKGQAYVDLGIMGVNVYNYCDGAYYLQGISKAVGSASGAVNQGLNFLYRFFSEDDALNYYNMSVGLMQNDSTAVATAFGTFLKRFLMADIPEVTTDTTYQSVGQLM